MDKKKIYIGYNNNIERCLLYKKDDKTYIDLENSNVYKHNDLILESLISYNKLVSCKGISFKNNIKKNFQKSENENIPLNEVFIGDIREVVKISNIRESKNKVDVTPFYQLMYAYCMPGLFFNEKVYMPESIIYDCHSKIILPDRLLRRTSTPYDEKFNYFDLLTGDYYPYNDKMLKKGDIIITGNIKSFKEEFNINANLFNNNELSKKKILSIYMENKLK